MYTKDELASVKKERNIFEYISFFLDSGKFRVEIPHAAYRPVVDTLQEACDVRDRMLASPHFPQARPHKEFATYVDPNLETRTY
jgi:hypothetical protein